MRWSGACSADFFAPSLILIKTIFSEQNGLSLCFLHMRYFIKQVTATGELWLVRATKTKQGVWGAPERAYGFFRRPTAERWIAKLGSAGGLTLEIVEIAAGPPAMAAPGEPPSSGHVDESEEVTFSEFQFALG
jgi:hypothetical protein